jgi:hypothetical protein
VRGEEEEGAAAALMIARRTPSPPPIADRRLRAFDAGAVTRGRAPIRSVGQSKIDALSLSLFWNHALSLSLSLSL